jgi:hypothetical protein
MKVFISWSGEESHAVAQVLRQQLPCIINAVKPFVSSEDISKGTTWFQRIGKELAEADFGILCLTSANQNSKWVQFEAGALAGRFPKDRVAPLLIDASPSAIEPPLSQFQLTDLHNKEDFFKLLHSINVCLGENALALETLKESFNNWWNSFSQKVKAALLKIPKKSAKEVERSQKDILEEVLAIVRSLRSEPKSGLEELVESQEALARLKRAVADRDFPVPPPPPKVGQLVGRIELPRRLNYRIPPRSE